MIDLYTWTTPNGRKISIMLEETELPYNVHMISIQDNEQFAPEFLTISPNNKIPAIVDRDNGLSIFESGAILIYLARKTGKLLPSDEKGEFAALQWLMWQMGGLGPMLGQAHQYLHFNPDKAPYASERFANEANRLYGVLDRRLGEAEYVAGADYSIADIACFPWIARFEWQKIDMVKYPNVARWYRALAARPAVQRGYQVPKDVGPIPMPA